MQQLGWISRASYLVKKANLKRLHILYDSIYITFINDKTIEVEKRLVVPGYGERNGCDCKGIYKDVSWWWWNSSVSLLYQWLHTSINETKLHRTIYTYIQRSGYKNWWKLNKVYSLVNSTVPMSVSWLWNYIIVT